VENCPMVAGAEGIQGLTTEILTYFVEHPRAIDNLEGITKWRLLSTRVRSTAEATQKALNTLVEQGYLRKIETNSGPLFQLNAENLDAAMRILHRDKGFAVEEQRKSNSGEETVEIRIKNLTKQLLLVSLSSRASLHLAPGQVSDPVHETEISRNEKVAKLTKAGWIKVIKTTS
jgi:hypothetical protein